MKPGLRPVGSHGALRPLVLLAIAILTAFTGLAASLLIAPAPAHADVEDFGYDSWDVQYDIGVGDDGRAIAHVTETLVARFPETDQNRGIVRSLPRDYQGASTDPRDFKVTDENGDPVPFETESGTDDEHDAAYVAVLTGDDEYVHGRQTYVIEYTLSDVILARDDGAADEFYWDVVPSARQQPISSFTAEIRFDQALAEHLTGEQRCYRGSAGSREECMISGFEGELRAGPMPLDAREGATIAVGLEPETVVQPPQRLPNPLLDFVPFLVAGAGLVPGVGGVIAASAMRRKHKNSGRGTVVAQYDVPPSLPPLIAAPIAGVGRSVVAAQLVHLAVNGMIRFEDGPPDTGFFGSGKPQTALRVIDPLKAQDQFDRSTLDAVFPGTPAPGTVFVLPKKDESFAKRMQALESAATEQAEKRGYFQRERSSAGRVFGWVTLGLVAVLAVLVVFGFMLRSEPFGAVFGMVLGVPLILLAIFSMKKHRVYTRAGAETREYLEGVKLFIEVAEADRLQMLQSYQGAERLQDGSVNVIHLYEKLLPYAMLFGLEKQWGKVLESWYSANPNNSIGWYTGSQAYNIGSIGDTVSQMVSSISSSVSYSSSSSGGSSGGGSVGGGGGGGSAGGR